VLEDGAGRIQRATRVQAAAALDEIYAAAEALELGAQVRQADTRFTLWAPTARAVALCLFSSAEGPASALHPMQRDAATGAWSLTLPSREQGRAYLYLVEVHQGGHGGHGLLRHKVTDPYALALTADSLRSVAADVSDPALAPAGWANTPRPKLPRDATDLSMYELHVRDFSLHDATVPTRLRGTYGAFAQAGSQGMRHLRALARAGLTDVHLLPAFDLATVPERGCVRPAVPDPRHTGPSSDAQARAVEAAAARDCFNWGYDPLHFNVPEGSYATDATDWRARILEFRQMVQALHRSGLRVGMDVVYNHMSAAGTDAKSVLDRIVPGYYHRLDAEGRIERSTCCDNTATEHRMMAKLMIDSAVLWVREYRIDSFRFDLMGHQPRAAMLRLQAAVDAAAGRHIHLIGEGWNFGEVKDGARFVQAAQGSLQGTGIATFSDRARDAVRGGGCCDSGPEVLQRQGWVSGLHHAPNAAARAAGLDSRDELARATDLVRAGLAGTLRDYRFTTHDGRDKTLAQIDYAGQAAGYVENHDNQTLFDILAMKLPQDTPRDERARVQVVALASTAFSQGLAYWHAGVEMLRSKSLDRNSYDSGDWFNRMDFSLRDNFFATGLPPGENRPMWPLMKPVLDNPLIKPGPREIRFTRDAFIDLLRIRASSILFRLPSAAEVQQRLRFPAMQGDAGAAIVGHLDGQGLQGAGFSELLYALNPEPRAITITLPTLRGRVLGLHPVHLAPGAADPRPRQAARWHAQRGELRLPPRTALVYVAPAARQGH
jgi:pullulanase